MLEAPAALLQLEQACAALHEVWAGALLRPSEHPEADVRAMGDDGLVRATESLAQLARRIEALQARCAAELAARSRGDDGPDLARKHGFASPERLIAQATGRRYSDAARLVAVGEATAQRASFTGESLPARHPHLAAALEAGRVCIDAADAIRRFLDSIVPRADRDDIDAAEEFLVERAPLVGTDGLARLIKHMEAHLDPDGVKPREDELRARRSLKVWEDASGMINLNGAFDPVNGAPIKLAIEALVTAELRAARDSRHGFGESGSSAATAASGRNTNAAAADPLFADDRTVAQMNADALADIARHSLSSTDAPTALRSVTVIARVDAEALVSGRGHATIDGIEQPISIPTARELALSAGLAPLLLGTRCERLDLGRSARLFSSAQKAALIDRDGGCAWPGCQRPPSHTEAHHIAWWNRDRGRTDVANGIMLCSHHHHRVHDDGWRIQIRDEASWFIPPAHLDPEQRPRAGNTAPERLISRHLAERRHGPGAATTSADHTGTAARATVAA